MIPLISLIALLQFSPDSTSQLIGTWLNHESTTGVTQIVITSENGALRAHAWGRCEPVDCDFGAADLATKEGTPTAVFDQGPAVTTMYFVRLPNDKLLAVYKSQYRDAPEYKEQDLAEMFERETPNTNDEGARRLLKKVSETYSNLTTAEFELPRLVNSRIRPLRRAPNLSPICGFLRQVSGEGKHQAVENA